MLKESKNRKFDSYRVGNNVLIISHITFRDCREHIFFVNLFRNSCVDTLAHPAGSTLSRQENQGMRERCWLRQRGQLYSHITLAEVDWTGTVTLSRDNFSSYTVKRGLSNPKFNNNSNSFME